jgi:hypothetical protein
MLESLMAMLKTLLGITDTSQDALLELVLQTTIDKALDFTRQPHLPLRLYGTVAEMAADSYYLLRSAQGDGAGEITGTVSSVSDNGQSVSYRDSSYKAVLADVAEKTLKNYQAQLERWRKVAW